MAADKVIFFPRYTTLAGGGDFPTVGSNLSRYEGAEVTVGLGRLVGAGTVTATFEESTDQAVWGTCGGSSSAVLTPQTEQTLAPTFAKAWVRLKITLSGLDDVVTSWASGFLKKRKA